MKCSEYLVDFLIKKGITDVFGYSGGYIVPFMDALYARKNEIKCMFVTMSRAVLMLPMGLPELVENLECILQLPDRGQLMHSEDWQMRGLTEYRF